MITIELNDYVQKILSSEIVSCEAVLLAVKRHQSDLEKSKDSDYPYCFDTERAEEAVEFIELLPDPKGVSHKLAGYQRFIIESIYGWVRKDDHSLRRFHKVFVSMARKQGKTLLIAGIILYEFLFGADPERSRQIFCTANDKEQAKIAFEMARKQLDKLRETYPDIKESTKRIREMLLNLDDDSYVRPLSRDTGAIDGFEPYLGVLDEYGASKTTEMMDLLETGQGELHNPLIIIISTANFNLNAPMHTIEYPRAKKILNGEIEDEEYFTFIAEQENMKELDDPNMWIKSNPLLEVEDGRERRLEFIRKKWEVAKQENTRNNVMVKHFNMWQQAGENSYLDIIHWNKTQHDEKPDLTGKRVWIGADAGKASDLFSISWFVPMDGYWWLDSYSFVGTKYGLDAKIKSDRMDYRLLQEKGDCEITSLESGVIDNERVFEWMNDFVERNKLIVEGVCFDRAGWGTLMAMIEKNRPEWPQIQVAQGTITLSEPTKQFRDDILEGKIKHSDNEVLKTAVMNAITKVDNNGLRIDKNRNSNKIDAIDAALDAYSVCFTESVESFISNDYVMSDDFGF